MADEIEVLRGVVRKVFGHEEGINVDPEAMRDGDLWWCAAEAIETTEAERSAIDAALAGVAAGPQATPDQANTDDFLDEAVTVESNDRWRAAPGQSYLLERMLDCLPGTTVRVVAAPTGPPPQTSVDYQRTEQPDGDASGRLSSPTVAAATPDQVLHEAETKQRAHLTDSSVIDICVPVDRPPGTRVRVVAVPTGDPEEHGDGD